MINLFWLCILILFYHIIGYSLLLSFINLFRKQDNPVELPEFPTITVLCPAYNEEDVIEEKIKSYLNLDYPKNKISMIVISDDSIDRTNEIVEKYSRKYSNIKLVIQKPRKGKPSSHNLVEPSIKSDYVLSTDANSIFHKDAIKHLVTIIQSNPRVGIASGELKLISENGDSGEGLYWKYESYIKKLESSFHSIIGSNGSIFLIRRELFKQVHQASVDDFERTLQCLKENYIAKYVPKAIVFERGSEQPSQELKRKIRIISREWFALKRNSILLNPFKYPKVNWMIFSHKILRWTLFIWAIFFFIANLSLKDKSVFFTFTMMIQVLGYLGGGFELFLESINRTNRFLKFPGYFVTMIYASLIAFIKFITGKQQATWNTIREETK